MRTCKILLCTALAAMFASCNMARQAKGTYNMVNCRYEFQRIDDITIAGINLSRGVTILDAPRIVNLLGGDLSSVPFGFTVSLGITNPTSSEAMFSGLDYVLSIDGIDFTAGSVGDRFSVAAEGTATLPIVMFFDIADMLRSETHRAVANAVMNFVGMGDDASTVTLNIRPSFLAGGRKVSSPVYIPVSFSFGGR